MADVEMVSRLRQGPDVWNRWRSQQAFFRPDLRGANLEGLPLQLAHLDGVDLDGAELSGCSLSGARLAGASLEGVKLVGASLREASMSDARLAKANLEDADLHSADLNGATLDGARLVRGNFESANLTLASLAGADLSEARLVGAKLNDAVLRETDLCHATFGARYSTGALPVDVEDNLEALLSRGADLSGLLRYTARTSLCNVDLSTVRNLDTASHDGPTSVGIDTLMVTAESLFGQKDRESQAGAIEIFLRRAGVHEEILQLFPILLRHPVFYSVFVSYSHGDAGFVDQLDRRLMDAGVQVWRDNRGKEAGAGISASLRAAIAKHDRVLLLCSRESLRSEWVRDEIRYAARKEEETGSRSILIPLFLDDSVANWTDREGGLLADRFGINLGKAVNDPVEFEYRVNELLGCLRTFRT